MDWTHNSLGLGLAYFDDGQYDEAIGDYNKVIELNPHPVLHYFRGKAHAKKGDYAQGLRDWRRALRGGIDESAGEDPRKNAELLRQKTP